MNTLLTAAEAFAALQKGKTVLCRYAGDGTLKADKSFSTLDQMPATVFGLPNYEFCIQLETIELAGITFTKPLTIEEYEEGQEVFVISTYSPSIYVVNFKTTALIESINSGFVQRDAENAKLQLKAFSKALGFEINNELSVIRLGEEPKKQRGKKSKAEKPCEVISAETQPTIVITEQTNVTTSEDLLVPETNEPKVDPEYQQTLDTLLQRVKESKTPAEVNAVYRYTRTWDDEQMKPILLATHKRLEELEKEKASANEPPSLMVQIQTAPDLTTLDALEIDVAARDPQIQPKLMGYVRKRRYELENPTPTQQESTPDYLLVDGF
ncbi:hypothetical protein J524_3126 [Acinetobacter baumannii 496487]|uniref:hypothetical protein n=3 Tax=Acinetobacter baumannii TaxID=470 RepID=UPI00044F8A6E|nr:hypothetical protein [Acinetobacter baumannii]EXC33288.1 hypothetical protein J552_4325 [Acinetobacter baumannii 951631]EXQ88673.1 hypothetical protein J681_3748 [Acinetobacter baumannii 1170863]EXR80944.1 hypothetical protein J682_3765 [Acinetobacter baumannii 214216]EYT29934.1 hypothetical protein J632_01976 [Acinetobacter baumannii 1195185_11]KCX56540.1 hypothetical protein J524_3126 [Acinetobacter baumannii 496487]